MVTKEWRCVAHDLEFETTEDTDAPKPGCPHGCSAGFVVQEFRTPFSIRNGSTTRTDQAANLLAKDYGLTDMRNDQNASVMQSTRRRSGGMKDLHDFQKAQWAPSLFQPQRGWAARGEPEPVYNHNLGGDKGKTLTPTAPILRSVPPILSKTVFAKPK